MEKQRPPNPQGRLSGFPYQLLWEAFGHEWESLLDPEDDDAIARFHYLRSRLEAANEKVTSFSRDTVAELIEACPLDVAAPKLLADRLFRLGVAFLIPELERNLGETPTQVRARVQKLAATVDQMDSQLSKIDLNLLVTLVSNQRVQRWIREGASPSESHLLFSDLSTFLRVLADLGEGAALFVDEGPVSKPATTVMVLTRRLIRDAAKELIAVGSGPITFKISGDRDAVTEAADLLIKYLRSLNSQFSRRYVIEVLTEYGLHTALPRGRRLKHK